MSCIKAVAVAALLILAGACDSQPTRAQGPAPAARASVADRGTVTGIATVCDGPMLLGRRRASAVYALRGGKRVGHARVTGSRYRLVLRPGHYLIGAPASADPPELVTVRPGRPVVVDFPDPCS